MAGRSRTALTHVEWRGTRMEYVTRGRFGGFGLKTISGGFRGVRPQNLNGGSKENEQCMAASKEFTSR